MPLLKGFMLNLIKKIIGSFIVVNDSENMDEDFSIHQRSTRPRKQPSKPNGYLLNLKTAEHFFNKERNVVAHTCTKKTIVVID